MSKLVQSEALILRRFRHGETSLVFHAFTRTSGRVAFLAKGARSGGKRAPVPLIPVVLLELIWSPSNRSELQMLRETSLINGYGAIHTDFERLAWAQAAIEVLSRTLGGEEQHEALFDLTLGYLETLNENSTRIENLFIRFRLKVLEELGYGIQLEEVPGSPQMLRFQPTSGKFIAVHGHDEIGIPIHAGAWKLLSMIGRNGWEETRRLRIQPEASGEIDRVLESAFRHSIDDWKPLESLKLLKQMPAMPPSDPLSRG